MLQPAEHVVATGALNGAQINELLTQQSTKEFTDSFASRSDRTYKSFHIHIYNRNQTIHHRKNIRLFILGI